PGHAGIGTGRQRVAKLCIRPGRAGDVSDFHFWFCAAKEPLASETRSRRKDRLFWAYRARPRLRSWGDDHRSRAQRKAMGIKRREVMDHEWEHRRCGGGVGKSR